MFHVVLYQPEIPPNTGNAIRLCANAGAHLHLVKPLGFDLSDKQLARAGLDYHDLARVSVHDHWEACCQAVGPGRRYALTTRGETPYDAPSFRAGDVLLFGCETRGLPKELLAQIEPRCRLRIPIFPSNRSMNLSNAVAVVLFEAWRQNGFAGGQ